LFCTNNKKDYIKTDLKATCLNGIRHDMTATYPTIKDSKGNAVGWLLELRRGEEYSMAACLFNGEVMPYEISNWEISEHHDLTKFTPVFYRLTR
jgi:hypothetical protein